MNKWWKLAFVGMLVSTAVYAAEINDLSTTDASNTARFPEGMAPSAVNNAARALEGLIARWFKDTNGSLDTAGSADTYTLSANQTLSAYYEGLKLSFEVTATNTGPSTLNVDSVGAKTITKYGGVELEAGDIGAGDMVTVIYDGTNFQLVAPVSPLASTVTDANVPLFSGTAGKFTDSGYDATGLGALSDAGITAVIDDDTMATASATTLATSESIKAYADALNLGFTNGTVQPTTAGTSFDFTGIPSGTAMVILDLIGVSLDGTDNLLAQIGDSGGIENTSYTSASMIHSSGSTHGTVVTSTAGCVGSLGSASATATVRFTFVLQDSATNTWTCSHNGVFSSNNVVTGHGSKALSDVLTQIRLTRTGTDNFDAGTVNVTYR